MFLKFSRTFDFDVSLFLNATAITESDRLASKINFLNNTIRSIRAFPKSTVGSLRHPETYVIYDCTKLVFAV